MEYLILRDTHSGQLERQVEKRLSEGWQLQGGVSLAISQGNITHYCQALVQHQPKEQSE